MPTNYPTSSDTTTNLPPKAQLTGKLLDGSDSAGVADHDDVHDTIHGAILAIQAALGVTGSFNFDAAGAAAAAQAASQPLDSDLTAIAALSTTSFGRSLLSLADAAALISTAGLDADLASFSVPASTTISSFVAGALDETTVANFLTALGLDADLATLALPASTTISTFGASLIDDANAAAALSTIGAAASSHNHSASEITSGTIDTARLGSGSATGTTFLAGDQTYKVIDTSALTGLSGAIYLTRQYAK
jgi:hypothetical protein